MNKKIPTYGFLLIVALIQACEDIYTADLEPQENVIVADARILSGVENNVVTLSMSKGFNAKDGSFDSVEGAIVKLIDSDENEFVLPETGDGIFHVNVPIDAALEYKIKIDYNGNTYTSLYESVQKVPTIDSIYGIPEIKVLEVEGENDTDYREVEGIQLYADISDNKESPYYRFTARKVMQYTYLFPWEAVEDIMYAWSSTIPMGTFNIASPQEYTNQTRIIKHPLYFMERYGYTEPKETFRGWILILYQHGLSKSAHDYYTDLNNQLESDGKLFDPLYVQARSNMECESDPEQLILGNFEISTLNEYRVFVRYMSDEMGYVVKPIPYFYEIPWEGEKMFTPPDFWETPGKIYPDE